MDALVLSSWSCFLFNSECCWCLKVYKVPTTRLQVVSGGFQYLQRSGLSWLFLTRLFSTLTKPDGPSGFSVHLIAAFYSNQWICPWEPLEVLRASQHSAKTFRINKIVDTQDIMCSFAFQMQHVAWTQRRSGLTLCDTAALRLVQWLCSMHVFIEDTRGGLCEHHWLSSCPWKDQKLSDARHLRAAVARLRVLACRFKVKLQKLLQVVALKYSGNLQQSGKCQDVHLNTVCSNSKLLSCVSQAVLSSLSDEDTMLKFLCWCS